MTAFAALDLRQTDGAAGFGAGFVLSKPAPESWTATHDTWAVDVVKGAKVAVARSTVQRASRERAFADGLTAANIGLDLICLERSERLTIEKPDEENLTWWAEPDTGRQRVANTSQLFVEFRLGTAHVTSRDAEGNPLPPTPRPQLAWHESFRYFRISQTTSDLHDAYRNAFLALEAILDHIAPQQKGEGEGKWFTRALREAGRRIAFASTLLPSSTDPLVDLREEFYTEWRCAISHAKTSRDFILPHDHVRRSAMLESLQRVGQFYLTLAAHTFSVRRGGGRLSRLVTDRMSTIPDDVVVYVTDDAVELDPDAREPSPQDRPLVEMRATGSPSDPSTYWTANGTEVAELSSVRRIVATQNGTAMFTCLLEADLLLSPDDLFEAHFGLAAHNRADLRSRFTT